MRCCFNNKLGLDMRANELDRASKSYARVLFYSADCVCCSVLASPVGHCDKDLRL